MFHPYAQHLAAATGFTAASTELLKLGANPGVVDASGKTPAGLAAAAGDLATTLALGGSGDQMVAAPTLETAGLASAEKDLAVARMRGKASCFTGKGRDFFVPTQSTNWHIGVFP